MAAGETPETWSGGSWRDSRQPRTGTPHQRRDPVVLPAQPHTPSGTIHSIVREHRGIVSGLHRTLDVMRNEDRSRNRKGNEPEGMALLPKLAWDLARLEPSKGSKRGKLKRA